MLKALTTLSAFLFSSLLAAYQQADLDGFLKKYPVPSYQDILVDNRVIVQGTNICATRYEMIKHIFGQYQKSFKVLEIGAAQGYFSFRIATDFPHAFCTMIEENNSYYSYHGNMLYDLCHLNNHLSNLCLLKKHIAIEDLQYLNMREHFDVVIVFLVIHQMHTALDKQIEIFKNLLRMGDNILIEVCYDAAPDFTHFVEQLSKKVDCEYLGQVKRFHDPIVPYFGKIFWFKMHDPCDTGNPMIKQETFIRLNGVYPDEFKAIE